MSGATVPRQRRAKKAAPKGKPRKPTPQPAPDRARARSGSKPAADTAGTARTERRAGRQKAPPSEPAVRTKPKVRSGPPPVDLEIDPDVLQFIKAIDDYRAAHDRPFPTWSEVLYVLKGLGYRKA